MTLSKDNAQVQGMSSFSQVDWNDEYIMSKQILFSDTLGGKGRLPASFFFVVPCLFKFVLKITVSLFYCSKPSTSRLCFLFRIKDF